MHSIDADGTNQVTLSNTLDDFQDSLVTESFESVKASTEESEQQTISPPETSRMSYSYVTEKRPMSPPDPSKTPRDTTSIVKKAQQFSESLNRPPKVTIRASSEEMTEQRLQELDAERRAVINISKTRNVIMSESDEAVEMQECLNTETTPSSGSIEVTESTSWEDNSECKTPVKFTGKKINLEDKPEKVDLYGNNIIQENDTTESVDRESIANLASTRKQWENLLQASPKDTTQKNTPKKISPVKHWEVKLPYKPVTSPETETVARTPSPEPQKMEAVTSSNNYENESAIEREIRLANEREQMLRREQEERTELLKRQNASKQQLNVEKFENNNNNSNEFKTMYHEMTEADRGSEMQMRETIIQQELNEQREREQAIARKSDKPEDGDMPESTESLIAREIRLQQERENEISKRYHSTEEESTEDEINNTEQTNGGELNYEEAIASNQHEGESLIARELRETREREEELRKQRERFSKTDISKEPEQVKAPVQEMPKKTVQPPPVQSVQSTRNFSTPPQSSSHVARNVKVAPISDIYEEEQERPQPVKKAETPIEKEIRLARERENELRQLKGLPLLEMPKEPVQEPVTPKSSESETHVYYKRSNPQSNSMKQYASSKLQKELMKQKERENAYRQEGRIVTTSEDHIDPVKYTDIAQINNNVPVKRNFVTRKSISSLSDGEKTPSENGDIETSKPVTLTPTIPQSSSKEPKFGRRSMPSAGGAVFSYKESSNKAESKIEKELREMREREEELRQSRVGSGVASPNKPDSPREISQSSHLSLAAQWEQKYSK
ncbi:hypothetical protein KUTeg_016751 [Tegillarca granosa]|uniref:A-kinase anchor protein 2 C-terminal domain-containing protein n=1 Tax=Tegillarca granosa TaxID=220873 RepID=A0ABQ9EQP8_TEGGR|nr:hypothetical protein KUTeg_016751 [Tegillarca granosa]